MRLIAKYITAGVYGCIVSSSILLFLATAWMHCDIDTVATVTALFRLLFARSSCLLS